VNQRLLVLIRFVRALHPHFDFVLHPGYKVDVMEVASMTSLLQPFAAAQLTIAIARVFGKAVKFRHCPATVSAPASVPVL
jgi:hypothetical protein